MKMWTIIKKKKKKQPIEADSMKPQDLEEKLDIMSESTWTSQQRNENYKKRKKNWMEILEDKSTPSDM